MSNKKVFIGIAVLALACYGVYKFATFSLFDDDLTLVEEIELDNKDYSIKIYYIPSDATIQSSIQIRKVKDGIEEVLQDYERYNFLESHKVKNDSLFIVINDTMRTRVKAKKLGIKLP